MRVASEIFTLVSWGNLTEIFFRLSSELVPGNAPNPFPVSCFNIYPFNQGEISVLKRDAQKGVGGIPIVTVIICIWCVRDDYTSLGT